MQRRAAATYFVLFVLVGGGAFGFIQVGMSQPGVSLDGPTYAANDTLTVDGRTYVVEEVTRTEGEGEGGHGGGGGGSLVGTLTYTNDSAFASAELANGSSTTYEGESYTVRLDNATETLTLVAEQNVSAILAADPAVENETLERDGTELVRYVEDGRLVPLEEYLPAPETLSFGVGEGYRYPASSGVVDATVRSVTSEAATVRWTTTSTTEFELTEGANVTLSGQPYLVHFPGEGEVQVLPADRYYRSYQSQLDRIDAFKQRQNGVWGVVILSVLAAVVLLSTAYLPVK